MTFKEKLTAIMEKNKSLLCVGLDPDPEKIPRGMGIFNFNRAIIDATANLVCAYKPNFAFYESLGFEGLEALKQTLDYIPEEIPVIGDAKRGDIGNTSRAYARAVFDFWGCDAVTVNPYMGYDSISPFVEYCDRGVFILCRTSNAGALDFQSLEIKSPGTGNRLYEVVARKAEEWNRYGNIGLVIGATYPDELRLIRSSHPNMILLVPGIGAQGGDLEKVVVNGIDAGMSGIIINSSRQVLYASRGGDFAVAARSAALELREQINNCRRQAGNMPQGESR